MKYCLLRIAYDNSFHGYQIQPNVLTVQGEILKALSPIGVKKIYGSSRTDSRVRSASTIIEVKHDNAVKVCKIVDSIKGIFVRGYYESNEFVSLRNSIEKEYLYAHDGKIDGNKLSETIDEFLGGNIDNFSKDPDKKVILTSITFSNRETRTLLLFRGKSFSWNFVRISAYTIIRRAEGKVSQREWKEMLSGSMKSRFKGDANNLILIRTKLPFEFNNYDSKKFRTLQSEISRDLFWFAGIEEDLGGLNRDLDFIKGSKR